jgi:hypothetical protein
VRVPARLGSALGVAALGLAAVTAAIPLCHAGSASESGYTSSAGGTLTLIGVGGEGIVAF